MILTLDVLQQVLNDLRDNATGAPYISSSVEILLLENDLGWSVPSGVGNWREWTSFEEGSLLGLLLGLDSTAHTEVADFDLAVFGNEDILRLDVSIHNAGKLHKLHAKQKVIYYSGCLLFIKLETFFPKNSEEVIWVIISYQEEIFKLGWILFSLISGEGVH